MITNRREVNNKQIMIPKTPPTTVTPINPFGPKAATPTPFDAAKNFLPNFVCSWLKDNKIREDITKRITYKKEKNEYGMKFTL